MGTSARNARWWLWVLPWFLMAAACPLGLPTSQAPGQANPDLGPTMTALVLAQTQLALQQTLQAPTVTPPPPALATVPPLVTPPGMVPPPTPTLPPTPTPLPTATPLPSPTPETRILAQAAGHLFCRVGPAFYYPAIETVVRGSLVEVLARDASGEFWLIRSPEGAVCWVWGRWLQTPPQAQNLPVATAPPPPPGAFSIGIRRYDTCGGTRYLVFAVVNRGPEPLESIQIWVKDVQNGTTYEIPPGSVGLGFPRCRDVVNQLPPGSEVEVWVPVDRDLRGRLMEIRAKACTEDNLRGQCVERTPFRQRVP